MGPYAPQHAPAAPSRTSPDQPTEGEVADFIQDFRKAVLTEAFWPCFEKEPVLQSGVLPGAKEFLGIDDLLSILVRGQQNGALTAYKHGDRYMRDTLFLAYLDGATICLSHAESFSPPLLALCQDLATEFDYVTARCILQPPNAPPAPIRSEQRDSIILQLGGEQHWFLCPMIGAEGEQKLPPKLLKQGDALYVPRTCGTSFVGFVPNTDKCFGRMGVSRPRPPEAQDTSRNLSYSVHIEITLRTQERSWGYLLATYLGDLLRDGSLKPDVSSFCRTACHKRLVNDESACQSVDRSLRTAVDNLAGRVDAQGVREFFKKKMEALRKEQDDQAKQALDLKVPPECVRTYSRVRVAGDVECTCKPGDSVAIFARGADTLRLPIAVTASRMVSDLSDSLPHKIGDLTCDDAFEALCVCQVLIEKECLEIERSADE